MRPGFMSEAAEGVWRIESGGVNAYIVEDGRDGLAIVDAGLPWSAGRIMAGIAFLGRKPEESRTILLTHADVDHVGGLSRLAAATGAEVIAGEETMGHIEGGTRPVHIGLPHILAVSLIDRFRGLPPARLRAVRDGDLLPFRGGLRAIAAPGHTDDHFAYFLEKERILFCGDIYRAADGLAPFRRFERNAEANLSSHRKLMDLHAPVVCPGHGDCLRETGDGGRIRPESI